MLLACRDLAIKMLTESLDNFFAKLEDTYFELADKSLDRKQRDDYFAARIETHNKRAKLAAQFASFLSVAFNKNVQQKSEAEQKFFYVNADPDQLSLVANEEYEENLTADKIVKRIKSQGGEELDQLEMRFARLLASKDDESANPMSPEAICDAFLQACKQLETGVDARLVAMQKFENELSSQVANVYHQINQYLIAQNVEPLPRNQRRSTRKAVSQNARDSGLASPSGATQGSRAEASHSADETLLAHQRFEQLSDHFNLLSQGRRMMAAQADESAMGGARHADGWLSFLDILQRKAPAHDAFSHEDGGPISHNLLGMLRDSGWAKQLPQLDSMTLELVSMLFEHIFGDPRLSPSMKSLIGRLQIPVLKVGMLDTGFFSQKSHPARLFLDELAYASLDAQDLETGMPRYDALAAIVNELLRKYDKDITVFSDALQQLRKLVEQQEQLAAQLISAEADELAAKECAELAQVTAEQLVVQRLSAHQDAPEVIVQFLNRTWVKSLQLAYGLQGESEPEFARRLQAMDDLLWSVQPKAGPDERFKMVNLLPTMLKTLEEGAVETGLSKAQAQDFFSDLVQCHAAAIRNGIKLGSTQAPTQSPQSSKPEELRVLSSVDDCIAPDPSQGNRAKSILPEKGEWVDFALGEGEIVRLRLSWISPQGTRYLFTNKNVKGQAFLASELEAVIRDGKMKRLVLEGSLLERAMQGVMSDLS
ncbi:DUF1631 family protein [Chitinibacter sp. GC72]|uniref:DUF1631 family protein n=1 Tax=Chitinibacter sp. GC72 TaxID=1526917 RepID=UPI0012FA6DA8|nr:DUF1631 family protein [Chitinibacter sp. GC72]